MNTKRTEEQETAVLLPDSYAAEMTAHYAEFAEEDRALAEAGMSDYAAGLAKEDAAP